MTDASTTNEHIQALVVEDNRVFVELVRMHLAAAADVDFDVTVAANAEEGLRRLVSGKYDIILINLYRPNGEGVRLVKMFLTAAPNIPIVVASAIDDAQGAAELLHAGVADFVAKSHADGSKLVSVLKAVAARHRAAGRVAAVTKDVARTLYDVKETLEAMRDIAPQFTSADPPADICKKCQEAQNAD